ncbi:MAG: acetyl-CoA carboxylase biotin carboxylase subunit, partial [Terriglobales bacterium]
VPLDYDPLLAKLIVHAPSRGQALARLGRALDEYRVGGIKTNVALFQRILRHPDFTAGRLDTGFLDRLLAGAEGQPQVAASDGLSAPQLAAIAAAVFAATDSAGGSMTSGPGGTASASSFSANGPANAAASVPAPSGWKRAGRREALREK